MADIPSTMSVSSRSRLIILPSNTSFFRKVNESILLLGSRCILLGKLARCLVAFRIKLEAACISGEFFPVIMVPSLSSIAAPQKIPSFPFPSSMASIAASLADFTTVRSSTFAFTFSMINSALSTVSRSTSPMAYSTAHLKNLLIISW